MNRDQHRAHTLHRLETRWKIVLSHAEYEELCDRVISDGILVGKLPEGDCYLMAIESKHLLVLYDRRLQCITTAQPYYKLAKIKKRIREAVYRRKDKCGDQTNG